MKAGTKAKEAPLPGNGDNRPADPIPGRCYVPTQAGCQDDVHAHGGGRFQRMFAPGTSSAEAIAAIVKAQAA